MSIVQEKLAELTVCDKGVKSTFDGYTIETYNPSQDEVIVWKFNTNTFDFEQINNIFKFIESSFPNNAVVAIPDDTILELIDKNDLIKILKDSIKDLEESK